MSKSIYIDSLAELPKMRLYHDINHQIDRSTVKTIPFFDLFHICCLIDVISNNDAYYAIYSIMCLPNQ